MPDLFLQVLNGQEVLQVYGSSELMTVNDILAYVEENGGGGGGGGGGYSTQAFVTTGTTGNLASLSQFVGWQSMASGAKTQPIPTSTGSLALITVMDLVGTAYADPITVVPQSGNIVGVNQVYTNYGSLTLLDTAAGWCSV